MKFVFMLLALFVLTDPVLAQPVNNTSECLQMYRTYMNDYGTSRFIPNEKMHTFIGRCLPDNSTNNPANHNKPPRHQKLLKIIYNDKRIKTVKA